MTDFKKLGAALLARGYRIIPIPAGKKGPVFDGWEKTKATVADLAKWAQPYVKTDDPALKGQTGYSRGNIGILTELTPAVDLDIIDLDFVNEMHEYVASLIDGDMITRVGRAPKRLLVFRTDEPFHKQTSAFFLTPDGEKHRVEVLGTGQQFVGYGVHPDTKKPYSWTSFEDLTTTDVDDLPTITVEIAQQIIAEFERRAEARGWTRKGSGSTGSTSTDADDFMSDFKQQLRITTEEVRAALALVPGSDDYDTWRMVGMALHHQYRGEEEGLDLWHEWSQTASNYDEEALNKRWESSFDVLPGRAPTTFASVLKIAKENQKAADDRAILELRTAIAECETEKEMIEEIAKTVARAELTEYHHSTIRKLMQERLKKLGVPVTLTDIKAAIKQHLKKPKTELGSTDELEIVLCKRVLAQYFARGAHIKRFAKTWWIYKGGVWRREDDEMIERRVLETLVLLRKEHNEELRVLIDKLQESRGDRLNALSSTLLSVMGKIVAQSSEDDPLNLRGFIAPRVVNCRNGELWFDDDGATKFKAHDPTHLLTSQLRCEYDDFAGCPTFTASLHKVFQRAVEPEEVIRHFYEVMGYIIQPTRDAAIWVMFKGPGENGKSFLLNVIAELMGSISVLAQPLADISKGAGPHFTDSLLGKLMLLDDDLKTNTLLPDDWMKKLSEAKLVTANPKFGKTFEFVARATPVILANTWPSTSDMSHGLRRRIMVFESNHRLLASERNPQHRTIILRDELPGVLNNLIAGFQRFLRRGSNFDVPLECDEAKDRLLSNANALVRFLRDVLVPSEGSYVELSKTYETYVDWMNHWEYAGHPLGRNKFYNALEDLGLKRVNHSNVLKFKDVALAAVEGVNKDPFEQIRVDPFDKIDDGL